MSDLQTYINNRLAVDAEFAEGFEDGYANFKLGVLLQEAREAAGITQEEIARRLNAPIDTIAQIENHAEEIRLTLLRQYAQALGMNLYIQLA